MFTVDGLRKLHGWTHACLNLVMDHLSTIPATDYEREVPGFGFGSLRAQAIHIFNCEGFWLHSLQGLPFADYSVEKYPAVADIRLLREEVSRYTLAYLSALTDPQLNANSSLLFPNGEAVLRTPAFVLHHVFTHAFHHKGQMVAMCRILGYPAPDTDLSCFD
jgi:uncharacterized damage-inducible protein DinB